jgi:LCP family protein required for cell wall assembly
MTDIEEYNVLHVGHECTSPLDKKIVKEAKRFKIGKIISFLAFGVVTLSLVMVNASYQKSFAESEDHLNALVDEIGGLSQENFLLSQQVESQEAVLQSIAGDFNVLQGALEGADSSGNLDSILTSIVDAFETDGTYVPGQTVELTEVEDDGTFDVLVGGSNGALMDTIIIASVNEEKEKVTIFSIPRDLYINGRKINEYYYYYGIEQLNRMVESITGLKIDKFIEVDLNGFVEVVDILGGIDIEVTETINDYAYPNKQGGYDPYFIEAGFHHMDGEEALKYARSRKSTSDFSRSQRQQEILDAIKTKLTQLDAIMDMEQLTELIVAGLEYSDSNIDVFEMLTYYYDYKDYELYTASDHGFVLDSSGTYLVSLINAGGAYILWPVGDNYENIQAKVAELVN